MPTRPATAAPSVRQALQQALDEQRFVSLLLSDPLSPVADHPRRVRWSLVTVRGTPMLQAARQVGPQEMHHNYAISDGIDVAANEFARGFRQARLVTTDAETTFSQSPSGAVKVNRHEAPRAAVPPVHNRTKEYLLPEGVPCPFLEAIGVMTPAGAVRQAKRRKFRQINRYLEFIRDILPALPPEGPLRVVDYGCGKSYLTFALHHYLTAVAGREVSITGLDLKRDVVADCQRFAEQLHLAGLSFAYADVSDYEPGAKVHLAVSLHACDTATDAALANAVQWDSDVILAVPCCQHELAPQLKMADLDALLAHGILKERFASMATDALRAAALETRGYQTDVIEFIDMEHTPKNVLIRGQRRKQFDADAAKQRFRQFHASLGKPSFDLARRLNL